MAACSASTTSQTFSKAFIVLDLSGVMKVQPSLTNKGPVLACFVSNARRTSLALASLVSRPYSAKKSRTPRGAAGKIILGILLLCVGVDGVTRRPSLS